MIMYRGRNRKRASMVGTRSRVCMGLLSGLLVFASGYLQAAPGVLSQLPLFLGTPVQPNIFFLLDDSGSMDWEVLRRSDGGSGSRYVDLVPDDRTEEEEVCVGYNVLAYDPTVTYTPWAGVDRYGVAFADADPNNAPVNPYTGSGGDSRCGSFINNINGRVCDLINGFNGASAVYYLWEDDGNGVYDGGTECTTAVNVDTLSAAEQTNYANWFSYYRKREYVMKRAVSEIVKESTDRMGFATINRNNHVVHGTEVGTPVKDIDDLNIPINATAVADKTTLLDNLLGIDSSNSTPLRLGLEHVGQYFMGTMTDGSLFGGTDGPPDDPDSASGSSPILNSTLGGTCQQNFAIVMSDGFWNGGAPGIANTDIDGAGPFDGQSYADNVGYTLADVAMHYYEIDLIPDDAVLADEVPAVDIDASQNLEYAPADATECTAQATLDNPDAHPNCFDTNNAQHLVTYTVAFGVRGTIPETDASGNDCVPPSRGTSVAAQGWPRSCDNTLGTGWPTPASNGPTTADDMMHAAWNGRGLFLSAKDPTSLIDSLQEAIENISSRNPVAAAAVAVDSSSIIGAGNVVQGKFNSNKWTGELFSYPIIDGVVQMTPNWAAHDLLDARIFSDRVAVTYNGSTGIPFTFPADYRDAANFGSSELSQLQVDDLMMNAPYLVSTTDAAEVAANQAWGEALVDYLLGDNSNEGSSSSNFRDRDNHKLGDILHSSPVYVGNPHPKLYYDASYQLWATSAPPIGAYGRREMIYVGANDGGLHAFDAETGEEVFVYFPHAVFSTEKRLGLHYLAEQAYEHRYYVDGGITITEVYADLDGTGLKWSTILVGTLRGGGRSIFAIDISDPSEFATANGVANNILWEFTHDELGYTYSEPTVAKMNNGRWAVIFGNGYLPGNTSTGEAALFIKYLDSAAPAFDIISTGVGTNAANDCLDAASDCNGLSTPTVADLGADKVADRVYAGDLMGNMWAFDVSSSNTSSWGLAYAAPLFTARDSAGIAQPITVRPAIILHPTERHSNTDPNTMLFFGTGQYLTDVDSTNTATNTYYGIWDNGSIISSSRDSALVEQTITSGTLGMEEIRTMTNNPVSYVTHRGWFVDLPDSGERVVSRAIPIGDIVIYNTIVPEASFCSSSGGYSWLMVQNLLDGSEPDFIALDVNGDGVFDSNDQSGDENVSGVKSGNIEWELTFLTGGGGVGTAIAPSADIKQYGVAYSSQEGRRSSWGRYMTD